jgi:DNA-binding MarR family transcriptional regulator
MSNRKLVLITLQTIEEAPNPIPVPDTGTMNYQICNRSRLTRAQVQNCLNAFTKEGKVRYEKDEQGERHYWLTDIGREWLADAASERGA